MTVLFTLTVSTVSRIRSVAKGDACANNERQLYASMVAFAAEHDGHLPIPAVIGESVGQSNAPNVMWAMDPNHPEGGSLDFSAVPPVGTLWPYMTPSIPGRQASVRCPADQNGTSTYGGTLNADRNFSYSINSNVGHPSGQISILLSSVVRPAAKILIYEENAPNDEWNVSGTGTNGDDLPSGRHGTGSTDVGGTANHDWYIKGLGNYCFFDGHVESLSPVQIITDEQNPTGNTRYSPLNQ
jgi:prepilin-type processing-associated H-X9-DG protein